VIADRPEVPTAGVVGTTRAVGSLATRLGFTIGTLVSTGRGADRATR
jgi:hypothetical protein